MEVIVPDEFLSVAIGKRGQNVRLASKLTGWHLDVNSESSYSETMKSGYDSLVALPGVGISMADSLFEKGLYSAEELIKVSVEDLTEIRGIGEDKAAALIENAKVYLAEAKQAAAMEKETAAKEKQEAQDAETTTDDTSQSPEAVSVEDALTDTEKEAEAEAENTQEN